MVREVTLLIPHKTISMSNVKCSSKKRTWYNNYKFPLVPRYEPRKEDEHNTKGFTFSWLFFKVWTLDNPHFELAIVCSSHWGVGVIGILPYLRWCVCIPLPERFTIWVDKIFSRKSKARVCQEM